MQAAERLEGSGAVRAERVAEVTEAARAEVVAVRVVVKAEVVAMGREV